MSAVEAQDLFRLYSTPEGSTAALQGLSLTVSEREVVVVFGPSGSGKTTLLRIIAGLDRPSAGAIKALGIDLGSSSPRHLGRYRRELTGYADQHYSRALAPELEIQDVVGLRLRLEGGSPRESRRRADELLERVGLHDRRGARPFELSGGEQQRVAVCAALAHGPRLFLADEPTGELDHATAEALYGLIAELVREEGCTCVIVSHDPESTTIADRVVHVRDGRVSAESLRAGAADEEIVVGRGGWLRLPETLLRRASITTRAAAQLEGETIVIHTRAREVQPENGDRRLGTQAPARGGGGEAVTVRGLRKTYGRGDTARVVFDGLDAEFLRGCFSVVTGPSGSGKSTLLNLIAGLDLPDAGEVAVLGQSIVSLGREARATFRAENLALVGQDPVLIPFLSAFENVELGLSLRGRANGLPSDRNQALDALRSVQLEELAHQRASGLSAGEQERVALARALVARPAILLADEPTARLDQANTILLVELLSTWAQKSGAAVICATHDDLLIGQADARLDLALVPAPLGEPAEEDEPDERDDQPPPEAPGEYENDSEDDQDPA